MTFWLIARLIASLVLRQPTSAELCVWPFLQKGSFKTQNHKKKAVGKKIFRLQLLLPVPQSCVVFRLPCDLYDGS